MFSFPVTQVLGVEGDKVIGLQHAVIVLVDHAEDLWLGQTIVEERSKRIKYVPFAEKCLPCLSCYFFILLLIRAHHEGSSMNAKRVHGSH